MYKHTDMFEDINGQKVKGLLVVLQLMYWLDQKL